MRSEDMAEKDEQSWRITLADLRVTYLWWYDTFAILPEYEDTHEGLLPAGNFIRMSGASECDDRLICDLHNAKFIERNCLPKNRIQRLRPFCYATPLQVLLTPGDFATLTTKMEPPQRAWAWFRLFGK